MKFVDFCAGIGGFRLGLEKLKMECVYSCEIDKECEKTYSANFGNGFQTYNIYDTIPENIPQYDIFCAGFPCQPFSIAGKREGFSDDRANIFEQIIATISRNKPSVVFLENVKNLRSHDRGKTFNIILKKLHEQGYLVQYKILNAKDFGVAQSRERLYIVGFSSEKAFDNFKFPVGNKSQRVMKDIIETGKVEHPISQRWEEYIELYSGRKSLSEMTFKVPKTRIKLEKPPREGIILDDCILQMRSSGIRAIPISEPSPTFAVSVSGGGAMIPIYAKERRHLSLVEMKRLMGFPDAFVFPVARTHAIKQLANAVCPTVITEIGREISLALKKE